MSSTISTEAIAALMREVRDPIKFARICWPDVHFYKDQRDIIYSVEDNDQTYVTAAHQMGKDFVTAFIVLRFFLTRHPVRVITTSVKDDHLRVLWGELGRFIDTSRVPMLHKKGGPLIVKHHDIRKVVEGTQCKISYLRGMVSEKSESMAGHHAHHTLCVGDEASGIDDAIEQKADTWAKRILMIGNPYPCQNFFKRGIKAGNVKSPVGNHLFRRVIRIKAQDSPNVRLALEEIRRGLPPSFKEVVPGVISYAEYMKRRAVWDNVRQCVGLDAQFWEGAEELLFPPDWLNRAAERARALRSMHRRTAKAIGIDPAAGGDKTAMAAVDELGIIELVSKRTPDTAQIPNEAIAFGRKHGVPPDRWFFDLGGGGKQHADYLRNRGFKGVQTVGFGEPITPEPRRGMVTIERKIERSEERYAYKNRRAQMFGLIRELLDPDNEMGFGIPDDGEVYEELRRQLSPIPLIYDREGRLSLPPKHKTNGMKENSAIKSLEELIGHSPDEADAVALAVYGALKKPKKSKAGVF